VHGWTGEWECGWPIAACSFSCPPCEVVHERSELCPGCVRAAEVRGVPTPAAGPAKATWRDLCRYLLHDHRLRTIGALALSHLAAVLVGIWAAL
jgi:hypothetical protein